MDESLIEEMRAAVRGDRERAEKRRPATIPAAALEPTDPEPRTDPDGSRHEPRARLRWLRRRRR
jgi:hypothetical protein